MKKYIFKQLDKHDTKTMFQLILERIDWFDRSRNKSTCLWCCFIRRRCTLERLSKCVLYS